MTRIRGARRARHDAGAGGAKRNDSSCGALAVEDRGRLATGLLADVVAVGNDPSQHIEAMQDVRFLMEGGKIYKRP